MSVPRQTGKTTLIRAEGTHTCLVNGRDFFYTAQTGKDARERWHDLIHVLRNNAALKSRITVSLRGGSEQVAFKGGGAFRVFAPTPESLHGYTPPKVAVDEAFALEAMKGELLMGAIGPAQITVVDKQIWIVSTRGTAASTFLHDWIARAMDGMPKVALFLWGAAAHHNPYDLDDIAEFHPGVGFELNGKQLAAQDVLDQASRHSRAEYERAFANRATTTLNHEIPPDVWQGLGPRPGRELDPPADLRACTLAYDVSADRRSAAVLMAWPLPAGRVGIKVVQTGPGTSWVPGTVAELSTRWRPASVRAVASGPVLQTTRKVRELGVEVDELNERQFAAATAGTLSAIDDDLIRHDGSPVLELSVTGLVTRSSGPDGKAFSRDLSVGDASPGFAAIAAFSGADSRTGSRPLLEFI